VVFYFLMVLALFAAMGRHAYIAVVAGVLAVVTGATFIRALARPAHHAD
jgi:hypothetical protein